MEVTIYCPSCKRKMMVHDGIGTLSMTKDCKKCKKRVAYNPITRETNIRKISERTTSSGMNFC